jgi:Tfp pilus assembly protein PilN
MKIEINLLPQDKKDGIRKAKKFWRVLGWESVILCMGIILFGFIFGINYLLNYNLQIISELAGSGIGGEKYQTIDYYEDKFSGINVKLAKISDIYHDQIYWSELFSKLNQTVPRDIEISALSTKEFSVFLSGKARNREDLLSFKDRLVAEDCFLNVNLPLSNLVSKEDVVFQIDLEISEECVKNK